MNIVRVTDSWSPQGLKSCASNFTSFFQPSYLLKDRTDSGDINKAEEHIYSLKHHRLKPLVPWLHKCFTLWIAMLGEEHELWGKLTLDSDPKQTGFGWRQNVVILYKLSYLTWRRDKGETTLQPWPCWQVPAQINHMGSPPARGAVVVWCFEAVTLSVCFLGAIQCSRHLGVSYRS